MSRTNAQGWDLKRMLEAVLNRDLTVPEYYAACDLSHAKYYAGRTREDDFPNPEELRHAATTFDLDYANLLVEFSWIEPLQEKPGYTAGGAGPLVVLTTKGGKTRKGRARGNPPL